MVTGHLRHHWIDRGRGKEDAGLTRLELKR